MAEDVTVEEITFIEEYVDELAALLIEVEEVGSSIGFLPSLGLSDARHYWMNILGPEVILLVATINESIIGSVQLYINQKQNRDQVEIAKLMIHPNYRQKGFGRLLMQKAALRAKQDAKSLLFLNTRAGDPTNQLYTSLGYIQVGRIPNYIMSIDRVLHATFVYYKIER
ncbi:GNAT family N-acetyltransferase [Paenibacillus antarcticus]|uniref:GCN5 family acetyltransferase n=1 Tax=Paenibacillus antarcticus TaxID=253703 RepID=A0A168JAI4_9BACL|nr:GNAT family N-acetyltransferase [Paenibacillus antarcticus]OAB40364.1 GCN5 family acetyltransferase [Paenibacillus antarcticus]